MATIKIYRQGDCGFIPITKSMLDILEKDPDFRPFKSNLIRQGEHGGRHVMEKKEGAELFILKKGTKSTKYLKTVHPIKILHGEHNELELPAGTYRIEIQREIGDTGTPRQVVD